MSPPNITQSLAAAGIDLAGASVGLAGAQLVSGPVRVGNERRWEIQLGDGRPAVLGQLVQELTSDASVRRRYRRDVKRWAGVRVEGLAQLVGWGPAADSPSVAPWRVRLEPEGERLDLFLDRRAPLDPGEASNLLAVLCDHLGTLHEQGLVIRDLAPSRLVLTQAGPVFVDIGLARVDILSTRTAASLVLEGSPYTAPELLTRTAVDGRADLYGVGVLAFRMLTGQLPFGDTHALLRPEGEAPKPSSLRPGLPTVLDQIVVQLLSPRAEGRPASARGVAAVLRGDAPLDAGDSQLQGCQNCDTPMPIGQRLCLSCGKVGVQFEAAPASLAPRERWKVVLVQAQEDTEWVAKFNELCEQLSDGEHAPLEFMVGDVRMYSKAEQKRRLRVPVTLFIDFERATADRVHERFKARGIKTKVRQLDAFDREEGRFQLRRGQARGMAIMGAIFGAVAIGLAAVAGPAAAAVVGAIGIGVGLAAMAGIRKANARLKERWGRSVLALRAGPAALPASDPLVAQMAALLESASAHDVKSTVGEAALLVQRLVDHRAANVSEAAEINLALGPVEAVVTQVSARVERLAAIDTELAGLDEGLLVRELAASRARGEEQPAQDRLLQLLDRLRELEEDRAQMFAGLLDAHDLMRRAVEVGLAVQDPDAEHERQVRAALNSLSLQDGA